MCDSRVLRGSVLLKILLYAVVMWAGKHSVVERLVIGTKFGSPDSVEYVTVGYDRINHQELTPFEYIGEITAKLIRAVSKHNDFGRNNAPAKDQSRRCLSRHGVIVGNEFGPDFNINGPRHLLSWCPARVREVNLK